MLLLQPHDILRQYRAAVFFQNRSARAAPWQAQFSLRTPAEDAAAPLAPHLSWRSAAWKKPSAQRRKNRKTTAPYPPKHPHAQDHAQALRPLRGSAQAPCGFVPYSRFLPALPRRILKAGCKARGRPAKAAPKRIKNFPAARCPALLSYCAIKNTAPPRARPPHKKS